MCFSNRTRFDGLPRLLTDRNRVVLKYYKFTACIHASSTRFSYCSAALQHNDSHSCHRHFRTIRKSPTAAIYQSRRNSHTPRPDLVISAVVDGFAIQSIASYSTVRKSFRVFIRKLNRKTTNLACMTRFPDFLIITRCKLKTRGWTERHYGNRYE